MNSSFYTGVSGLMAFQEYMNVIGNNMANVGTTGFKAVRPEFQDLLYSKLDVKSTEALTGHGVKADSRQLLFSQGNPNQTNRELDFAIIGDGFFAVERDGQVQYTRNGSFDISVESKSGYLVTSDGAYVLDNRGRRISLLPQEDGKGYQLSDVGDRVGVYFFENPYGLAPAAGSSFLETESSGPAVSADRGEFADRYRLLTSTLEQSAVSLSDEMVNLITAQRGYQISARMVTTSDEIEEVLNNLR